MVDVASAGLRSNKAERGPLVVPGKRQAILPWVSCPTMGSSAGRNQKGNPAYVGLWRSQSDATSFFCRTEKSPMLKNLMIVFGLVAGLSACAAPYGYTGYAEPAYYGPVYYGPGYYPIHTSPHGTVQ
jgi:hypothetical protein